jgi:hypothetical protein
LANDEVSQDQLHDDVPEADCHAPPSTDTATDATDTLSEAEPETLTTRDTVEPDAGDVMLTDGGAVSAAALLTITDSLALEIELPLPWA